jgi:hypothetical protein
MRNVPWAGLVALLAMFLLPARLFEPRTIKHRPVRQICADCGARWAPGHTCDPGPTAPGSVDRPAPERLDPDRPVKVELVRLDRPRELEPGVARGLRRRRRP